MSVRACVCRLKLLLCALVALGLGQAAQAANYVVNQLGDTGNGSLRWAITQANSNAGPDTITFDPALFTGPTQRFILLDTALPAIADDLTITGPGSDKLLLSRNTPASAPDFPILQISGSRTVTLEAFMISLGRGSGNGAGVIASGGSLTIRACTIRDCISAGAGAAVYMRGAGSASLTIIDTTITTNTASDSGAGVLFYRDSGVATLTITGSAISRSTLTTSANGKVGGGLYVGGPEGPHIVNITGATFNGNSITTGGVGGGFYADMGLGQLNLDNCTFAGNLCDSGSAIGFVNATVRIRNNTIAFNTCKVGGMSSIADPQGRGMIVRNTILSGNASGATFGDLAPGQSISGNNNLVGVGGSLTNGVSGNIVGATDPRLVQLNDNGGVAPTFALQPDSPAVDAGSNADALSIDARGQSRPADGDNNGAAVADIGAFESQRYVVTTVNDSGPGTLRQAIVDNNLAGGGFVRFAIGAPASVRTITLATPLPTITRTVYIDGWSQGGGTYASTPLIEVSGASATPGSGLTISWSDSIIRGLSLTGFTGTAQGTGCGIALVGANAIRTWVYGCMIGLAPDGTTPRPNASAGVWIGSSANSNLIGSNGDNSQDISERNVIAGSLGTGGGLGAGVYIESNSNVVAGNFIGCAANGATPQPNGVGVVIARGSSNRIGALTTGRNPIGERNVISGNAGAGVAVQSSGSNNAVLGNLVGTTASGNGTLGNQIGILLDNVTNTTVGGNVPTARNIVSGNRDRGIVVSGAGATGNLVQGNYVGTNFAGTAMIPNAGAGIAVTGGASFTRIGGTGLGGASDTARANVVCASGGRGIEISGSTTSDNSIYANIVGLAPDGLTAMGNGLAGIGVIDAPNTTIGGPGTLRNVVSAQSGAAGHGIEITGLNALNTKVQGNLIGVAADGSAARPNAGTGVLLSSGAALSLIGGDAGLGNTILNNLGGGVRVLGDTSVANAILGNTINANTGLGIDLRGEGVTPNAPAGTVRTGPNNLQNYPVISTVSGAGVVTATLSAKGSSTYRVEFFAMNSPDKSGFGEGPEFVGFTNVQTDASGNAGPFTFSFTPTSTQRFVSATATELASGNIVIRSVGAGAGTPLNTSEFSESKSINLPPTASNVVASGLEDQDLVVTLQGFDPDANTTLTFSVQSLPTAGQLFQFGTLAPITAAGTVVTDAGGRVVYRGPSNVFGASLASFQFNVSDGLVSSGNATATVNLSPVADTPSVTNAATTQSTQTTSGLVIQPSPVDGPEVTHFKITGISGGRLFKNNGVTEILSGSFITVAEGAAGLKFTPTNLFIGNASFQVQASIGSTDAGLGGGVVPANIAITALAFTPIVSSTTTNEDTQSGPSIVIQRSPLNGAEVTHFRITGITNGTVQLADGVTQVPEGGFVTAAQGAAGLRFTPSANYFGPAGLNVQSSLSGLGGGVVSSTITVLPVADTPSVTSATTIEDTQTTSGLVISRNSVDGSEVSHFKITAITSGRLFKSDGVTEITSGQFITASEGAAGLRFTPSANFFGQASFRVQASLAASDTGLGGALASATIDVASIADTPTITSATTLEDTLSTSGLIISRNAADGAEVTHFQITAITSGRLFKSDGVTEILSNQFITVSEGAAGLRFLPAANSFGPASFRVQASLSNSVAGLGGSTVLASITVLPVADTPSVTNASTSQSTQTTSGLVISRAPVDGAEVTHFKITSISGGRLFQSDGVTQIADGSFITAAQGAGGLRFTPTDLFIGNGSFRVQASVAGDDSGLGGSVVTATISVAARAFTPSITDASTNEDTLSSGGLVVSRSTLNGAEVTHFKLVTVTRGSVFLADGVTPVPTGTFFTVAQGAAGMRFRPSPDYFGNADVTVQASLGPSDAGVGGSPATARVVIAPVADTPSVTGASTFENIDTAGGLVVSCSPVDGPEVAHFQITQIKNGSIFTRAGGRLVTEGSFITAAEGAAGLRFAPTPGFYGNTDFTVRASLSPSVAGIGGGPALAMIIVNPINKAPSFAAASPRAGLEGGVTVTQAGFITSFVPGPADESGQRIAECIVDQVSNPGLFTTLPTVGTDGTLRFTTANTGYGTSTFRLRVRDDGGIANGGNDTSLPQTFTIVVRPAAVARDVTIDARTACVALTVTAPQLNATPTAAGPGATQAVGFSRSLTQAFPIGITPVTVTVTYSDGLVSTAVARVTVLAGDCNNNGIPDTCDIASGAADCNADGVIDDCQCLWDNGLVATSTAQTANGQLSHLGGGVQGGAKVVDDVSFPAGTMNRIFGFTGQMLTSTTAAVRKARLEFYTDCDGRPSDQPFATFQSTRVSPGVPGNSGFDLVTYVFDLCSQNFWLEGGKTYWVALVGISDNVSNDLSYWVTTTPGGNNSGVMGGTPLKRFGTPGSSWGTFNFGPWSPTGDCCAGCTNMAFRISGESCPIVWNNGLPDLSTNRGGEPSGALRTQQPTPRSADNFTLRPCDTVDVCYIETYIWTNCSPVQGFLELYATDCGSPLGTTPLRTATASQVVPLNQTVQYVSGTDLPVTLQGYKLVFTNLGWSLDGSRRYWLSSGSTSAGALNAISLFAYQQTCNRCDILISPGQTLRPFNNNTSWLEGKRDFAFRIAARSTIASVGSSGSGTGTPTTCAADITRDGFARVDDIFAFLSAWFTGCP